MHLLQVGTQEDVLAAALIGTGVEDSVLVAMDIDVDIAVAAVVLLGAIKAVATPTELVTQRSSRQGRHAGKA